MVSSYRKTFFVCECDLCGLTLVIEKSSKVYNRAQAARSFGFSYGRNRKCYFKYCR